MALCHEKTSLVDHKKIFSKEINGLTRYSFLECRIGALLFWIFVNGCNSVACGGIHLSANGFTKWDNVD